MADNVNHPKHYTSHPSGVECIEITEHYGFCVGNAIKYLWRAGLKKDGTLDDIDKEIEDVKKAAWYVQRHLENLQKKKKQIAEEKLDRKFDEAARVQVKAEAEWAKRFLCVKRDFH
jgi:hypothetical protein